MDSCLSCYTPHTLASSYRSHIRWAYPESDLKDKEKIGVFLAHCDTDNRHSISCTHSTGELQYPSHYGNEHICFHRLLVIPELEPLFHPYLGTNCDACSIFFVKINQTFFQSTDHITCLYWLWNLDG